MLRPVPTPTDPQFHSSATRMSRTIGLALALALAAATVMPPALHAAPETFAIDPGHTYPNFAVSHLGFSTMYGRFNSSDGSLSMDREAGSLSIELVIDARSVDTGHDKRDDHLRAPDFFNVAEFPQITFRSTGSTWSGGSPVSVAGDLTLLGVTRPVTLTIDAFRCGEDPWKNFRCGADASATLKRSDFGMTYGLPGVSDDVRMMFEIEAVRR